MIDHLTRLNALRKEISGAGVLGKAKLAAEIGEESYQLALCMAERILKLESEVAKWKPQP